MDDKIAQATIVAGMWVDGWTGYNKLTVDEVHKAYVPNCPVTELTDLVYDMRMDDDCPLRGTESVPVNWNWRENHVGLSADGVFVAMYIGKREPTLLPADLKRMK